MTKGEGDLAKGNGLVPAKKSKRTGKISPNYFNKKKGEGFPSAAKRRFETRGRSTSR